MTTTLEPMEVQGARVVAKHHDRVLDRYGWLPVCWLTIATHVALFVPFWKTGQPKWLWAIAASMVVMVVVLAECAWLRRRRRGDVGMALRTFEATRMAMVAVAAGLVLVAPVVSICLLTITVAWKAGTLSP